VNLNYEGAYFKSSHAVSDFPVNTTQTRYPFMIAIGTIHSIMNNKVFLLNTTIAILVLFFFIAILRLDFANYDCPFSLGVAIEPNWRVLISCPHGFIFSEGVILIR
jgi:hypothetical protein